MNDATWPTRRLQFGSYVVEVDPSRFHFSSRFRWLDTGWPRVSATLPLGPAAPGEVRLASAAMLLHKARLFNEGLRAVGLPDPPPELWDWALASLRLYSGPERARFSAGADHQRFLSLMARGAMELEDARILDRSARRRSPEEELGILEEDLDEDDVRPGPIAISPRFAVEPCLSFYVRLALTYRSLRMQLARTPGAETLGRMQRPGRVLPLDEDLSEIEGLFWGAGVLSARDLGIPLGEALDADFRAACARAGVDPERHGALGSGRGPVADIHALASWRDNLDADMTGDVRRVVVIGAQPDGKIRLRATLGWLNRRLRILFGPWPVRSTPIVRILEKGRDVTQGATVGYAPTKCELFCPLTFELSLARAWSDEELRALCEKTRGDVHGILDELHAAETAD